jgi:hypothetical protein
MANVMVRPLADSQGELADASFKTALRDRYVTQGAAAGCPAACARFRHGAGADPTTGNAVIILEGGEEMSEILNSNDLMKLGYAEDDLLLDDPSLCGACTSTCNASKCSVSLGFG